MFELKDLENKSLYILREAYAEFERPAVLWSTGKDSTAVLWLCYKAFYGKIPFPVIHIDTTHKFPEMYKFRDNLAKEWGFDLRVARNEKAIAQGVGPEDLQKRLAECGCRRTPQTVVKWLQDPNMIGPKDTGRGALRAIAEATGDVSLKARIDECAAAIHKVRAAHLQASHRLAQLVLQAVAKEVDGQVFEDYLRLEDGTLLCRVTDLDRATIEVASGSTNRLLNLGVAE